MSRGLVSVRILKLGCVLAGAIVAQTLAWAIFDSTDDTVFILASAAAWLSLGVAASDFLARTPRAPLLLFVGGSYFVWYARPALTDSVLFRGTPVPDSMLIPALETVLLGLVGLCLG